MNVFIRSCTPGAMVLAAASASHAGVTLPAHAESGQYYFWTGEVVSNSFTSGPFAEGDWSVGSTLDFFAILQTYDVLEKDALAESFVASPSISSGGNAYPLTEDVPFLFGNDDPGDSITWSAEFLTGEAFTLDLYDEDGDVFSGLGLGDFLIDGAEFEENLAQVVGLGGLIEITIIEIKSVPAPGAWCLLALVGRRSRRRRGGADRS